MRRLNAACVKGAETSFDVHAFARGSASQTGYDAASAIGATIEATFAGKLTLENGATCALRFSDARMLRDAAPDDWHWFAQCNARVLAAPA